MTHRLTGSPVVAARGEVPASVLDAVGTTDKTSIGAADTAAAGSTSQAGSSSVPHAQGSRPRRPKSRPGSGHELRAEILSATKVLLAETADPAQVSIRAIADSVGVSTMALYLHFADKQELFDVVVEEIFAELEGRMVAASAGIGDPVAALCAQGSAYVDFALEHAGPYRYAMLGDGPRHRVSRAEHASTESAYRHFVAAVADCIDAGAIAPEDPHEVSLEFWTVANGIAAVLLTNPSLPWGDTRSFVDRVLRSAVLGHAAFVTMSPHETAAAHPNLS